VLIEPFFRAEATTQMTRPLLLFPDFTILEIKFTTRFPNWFKEMVKRFNLVWAASAKYAGGVVAMGEHHFHDGYQTRDWQGLTPQEMPLDEMAQNQRARNLDTMLSYD
jgi:hypothetical protein